MQEGHTLATLSVEFKYGIYDNTEKFIMYSLNGNPEQIL